VLKKGRLAIDGLVTRAREFLTYAGQFQTPARATLIAALNRLNEFGTAFARLQTRAAGPQE
jgi:hypothetical protein